MENGKNIYQKLADAMSEVTYIQKDRKKGMQYTVVSHDVVTAKVRPVLLKHGIVYHPTECKHTHNGNRAECSMTVRFVNTDNPSDYFDVPTFGYGVDSQDKGPGKAMSYAVKYALLKAMGLETGDDADHDAIEHSKTDPDVLSLEIQTAIDTIDRCNDLDALKSYWAGLNDNAYHIALEDKVIAAKNKMKTSLTQKAA